MVIWLIGMSASGKTTIGQEMIKLLRQRKNESWVFLDGDAFRNIMGENLGHTVEDRRNNAEKICRFCAFLDMQNIHVLSCVLSIFPEHQIKNRENFTDYKQVYIQVDYEKLKQRDNKQLYAKAEKGEINHVVGVQIDFPDPVNSDYTLDNNHDNVPASELADQILSEIGLTPHLEYSYTKTDLLESPIKYQYSAFEGNKFFSAYKQSRQHKIKLFQDNFIAYNRATEFCLESKSDTKFVKLLQKISAVASTEYQIDPNKIFHLLSPELWTSGYEKSFLGQESSQHVFLTRPFLMSILQKNLTNPNQGLSIEEWGTLFKLIQRFEVSKKIFIQYRQPEIRKIDSNYSDLLNFVLFHCVLTIIHNLGSPLQGMVMENCLLKLGDILDSCFHKFFTPAQSLLCAMSLQKELRIMEEKYGI